MSFLTSRFFIKNQLPCDQIWSLNIIGTSFTYVLATERPGCDNSFLLFIYLFHVTSFWLKYEYKTTLAIICKVQTIWSQLNFDVGF